MPLFPKTLGNKFGSSTFQDMCFGLWLFCSVLFFPWKDSMSPEYTGGLWFKPNQYTLKSLHDRARNFLFRFERLRRMGKPSSGIPALCSNCLDTPVPSGMNKTSIHPFFSIFLTWRKVEPECWKLRTVGQSMYQLSWGTPAGRTCLLCLSDEACIACFVPVLAKPNTLGKADQVHITVSLGIRGGIGTLLIVLFEFTETHSLHQG